jgi:hypothetical protein
MQWIKLHQSNKHMLKKIALFIALAFIGYGLFTLGDIKGTANFKGKLDSLDKVNDSLAAVNILDDKKIAELKTLDSSLTYQVEHQKAKVVKIKEYVQIQQGIVDTFSSTQTIDFLYKRYPEDTVSEPSVVAHPVLKAAVKDLVELDGARQILPIKDSVIAIQESRITLKDSTITLFTNKEGRYKTIIGNKDQAIAEWSKQYDLLNLNYKKLQVKNKFQKLATYVIIGGLTYTLLAK